MTSPNKGGGDNNDGPKQDGTSDPIVIPTVVLERFKEIESSISRITDRLGSVSTNNNVITMVLFALVVAVVLGAVYQFIGSINSDITSRNQLTQTVNDLKLQVEILQKSESSSTTTHNK